MPPAATATVASFDRFPPFSDASAASIFTIAGLGASHAFATARTVFGNVALNSSVCRPGLDPSPAAALFPSSPAAGAAPSRSFAGSPDPRSFSSCSANPSASMRSASSSTSKRARSNPSAPLSVVASNLMSGWS